jgi:quercetin dioxygenase-like cupin family protein
MIDVDEISRDWRRRGFSCDVWVDPPGRRWEDFVHAEDELVVVLEGEMEFEITDTVIHPEPGAELFIPAGAVHSARNRGRSTARWLYGYRRR